jgi:hypothetical protein
MFLEVEHVLNTFENVSTKISSFEILYDVKLQDLLLLFISKTYLDDREEREFLQRRQEIRNNVKNAIKLSQIKMTILYNKKHRSTELSDKAYIKMIQIDISDYHLSRFFFLSIKKINLFRIIRKIEDLMYELDLLSLMKIHFNILIAYLEQAIENTFNKIVSNTSSLIIVEDQKH